MASGISSERGHCKHTDVETKEVCECTKLVSSKSGDKLLCGHCGHHASFHLPGDANIPETGRCSEKSDSVCEDGCQQFFPPHDSLLPKNCGGCGCHRYDHRLEGENSASGSSGDGIDAVDRGRDDGLDPKHKIFLSFSGAQRRFAKKLYDKLVSGDRYPFYDRQRSCLPLGENAPKLMWDAIKQCRVGVVILSEEYFTRTKWPMLELVRMTRESKRKENPIKIIPVFLGISHDDCRDPAKLEQWSKIWEKWASAEKKKQLNNIDVDKWVESVQEFFYRSVQRLELRSKGQQGAFREEIVDAIRKEVRPEFVLFCGDVQGRKRLYKESRMKIFPEAEGENAKSKVRVVGLYGVGGLGKTTLCKVLHNELSPEFRDKVCHVDLGEMSAAEVYRKVTRRFVELEPRELKSLKYEVDSDKFVRLLNSAKLGNRVFLAVDDVTDEPKKVALSSTLKNIRWRDGSVVLVASRSLDVLIGIGIDRSQCFRMFDLEEGEARALFLESVRSCNSNVEVDEKLIEQCVNRCYFSKGDGTTDRHWHPLALKVLASQMMCTFGYNPDRWKRQLKTIDTFNATHSRSDGHPVFSILRSSFDALKDDEKLLFMNIALFKHVSPISEPDRVLQILKNIVYGDNERRVIYDLVSVFVWLRMVHDTKDHELYDMLESLKRKSVLETIDKKYGGHVHDLWVEFAREETREGNIARIYETPLKLSKGGDVQSMRLEIQEKWAVKNVDLNGFPMLSVLHVSGLRSNMKLDVSNLSLLKSLVVMPNEDGIKIDIKGLGALESLSFLRIWGVGNSACLEEIADLTNLQILDLEKFLGDELPDLGKLTQLRALNLGGSKNLRSVELRNLPNLRVLDVGCGELLRLELFKCTSLSRVWHLGCNKVLQELRVSSCTMLDELPELHSLKKLTVLHIFGCPVTKVCICVSLEVLDLSLCRALKNLPEKIDGLEKLQELKLYGCGSLEALPTSIGKLTLLNELDLSKCGALKNLPEEIGGLEKLQILKLSKCRSLEALPTSIGLLTHLNELDLSWCGGLKNLPEEIGDLEKLQILKLYGCRSLEALPTSIGKLTLLTKLDLSWCIALKNLPKDF